MEVETKLLEYSRLTSSNLWNIKRVDKHTGVAVRLFNAKSRIEFITYAPFTPFCVA